MAAREGRFRRCLLRRGVYNEVAIAHRRVPDGEFEHPVEQHSAAAGLLAVEPEGELVETVLEMLIAR